MYARSGDVRTEGISVDEIGLIEPLEIQGRNATTEMVLAVRLVFVRRTAPGDDKGGRTAGGLTA